MHKHEEGGVLQESKAGNRSMKGGLQRTQQERSHSLPAGCTAASSHQLTAAHTQSQEPTVCLSSQLRIRGITGGLKSAVAEVFTAGDWQTLCVRSDLFISASHLPHPPPAAASSETSAGKGVGRPFSRSPPCSSSLWPPSLSPQTLQGRDHQPDGLLAPIQDGYLKLTLWRILLWVF